MKLEITAAHTDKGFITDFSIRLHEGFLHNKTFKVRAAVLWTLLLGKVNFNAKEVEKMWRTMPSEVANDKETMEFINELKKEFKLD